MVESFYKNLLDQTPAFILLFFCQIETPILTVQSSISSPYDAEYAYILQQ